VSVVSYKVGRNLKLGSLLVWRFVHGSQVSHCSP